ncbi:hypothetical protein D3C84_419970 [compost metagenome]
MGQLDRQRRFGGGETEQLAQRFLLYGGPAFRIAEENRHGRLPAFQAFLAWQALHHHTQAAAAGRALQGDGLGYLRALLQAFLPGLPDHALQGLVVAPVGRAEALVEQAQAVVLGQ